MTSNPLRIGTFDVHAINIGDIHLPIAPNMQGPARDRAEVIGAIAGRTVVPMQDLLVQGPAGRVLVDAGAYDLGPSSGYRLAGYQPPEPLHVQLAGLGVAPERIDHVVITHSHWDHFNGTTLARGRERAPTFPNARHYIGRADWEDLQGALSRSGSREAIAFGCLRDAGLLQIVDDATEIMPGVTILPAPGETRGHQIVRFASQGDVLYALGDLYHHPIETAFGDWMMSWAQPHSNRRSRARLLASAIPERAWFMASHIPGFGRADADGRIEWR